MNVFKHALAALALLLVTGQGPAIAGEAGNQPGSARQIQLRQMLQQNCSVCHGKALQGDIGPALTPKSLAGKNEQMLVTTILEGREGTVMPSWEWTLQENEARWLVHLLRKGNGT